MTAVWEGGEADVSCCEELDISLVPCVHLAGMTASGWRLGDRCSSRSCSIPLDALWQTSSFAEKENEI